MDVNREVTIMYMGLPCTRIANPLGEDIMLRLTTAAKGRLVFIGLVRLEGGG